MSCLAAAQQQRAASSAGATTSGRASSVSAGSARLAAPRPAFAAASSSTSPLLRTPPKLVARAGSDAPVARLTAPQPPAGVTVPPRQPDVPEPRFGFVDWAEKINGRACMIGFFALLLVESVSGRGLLEIMGATVGQGLGFEL